ncbi:hypothetical protein DPEC_G00083680 [Dallia pectoralis]|uniref:Uncharacterized protein n=1 Tax=Dallia pectoralis TaxID=75939 RepID=A0ACC2GZU2_DALPE|nr:hypothetical protein DPEC_G00083680 [Dallia pectoralis]
MKVFPPAILQAEVLANRYRGMLIPPPSTTSTGGTILDESGRKAPLNVTSDNEKINHLVERASPLRLSLEERCNWL